MYVGLSLFDISHILAVFTDLKVFNNYFESYYALIEYLSAKLENVDYLGNCINNFYTFYGVCM